VARLHGLSDAPGRRATAIALAGLMVLAAALLLAGLTRDLPSPEPDEPFFVLPAIGMAAHGSLDPHWFGHPASTVITPLALVYRAREVVFHGASITGAAPSVAQRYREDPASFYVIGRLWTIALTVLTIPLVYLVGRRIMSPLVGLLAAGAWTVLPLVLDYGRVVRSDSAATCFGLLAFLACLRAIDVPSWRRFAIAGAAIGLAVSTRYFMLTLMVVLAGAWWCARRDGRGDRQVGWWQLLLGGGAALGAFAVMTPFLFLDWSAAERSLTADVEGIRLVSADVDGDGLPDLLVHGIAGGRDSAAAPKKRLFLNKGGKFVEATAESGLLDPAVAERTLGVRAPAVERVPDSGGPDQDDGSGSRLHCDHGLVRQGRRCRVDPGHGSRITSRLRGARNSQPVKTGGRSGCSINRGKRSTRRRSAIRICTREK